MFFSSAALTILACIDDGVAMIHSIGRASGPGATNAFTNKYIFPGGYIPGLSEIVAAIEGAGLWITDIEILRLHYAETLRHWMARYLASFDQVSAMRDAGFARAWHLYLAGSQAAFTTGCMQLFQVLFARGTNNELPRTRRELYA